MVKLVTIGMQQSSYKEFVCWMDALSHSSEQMVTSVRKVSISFSFALAMKSFKGSGAGSHYSTGQTQNTLVERGSGKSDTNGGNWTMVFVRHEKRFLLGAELLTN